MVNIFLKCSNNILRMIKTFCEEDKNHEQEWNYREKLIQETDTFEQKCIKYGEKPQKIKYAKYALIALIDEVISDSKWELRHQWMSNPLQKHYFSEHLAGQKFFEYLKKLILTPEKNIDLLEVYHLCLQFGFKGTYRLNNQEKIVSILNNLSRNIAAIRQDKIRKAETSKPILDNPNSNKKGKFIQCIIISTIALIFGLQLNYKRILHKQIALTAQNLKQLSSH